MRGADSPPSRQGMDAGPAKRVSIVKGLRSLSPPLIAFLGVMFIIAAVIGYVLGPARRQGVTVPAPAVAPPPEIVESAPSTSPPAQGGPPSGAQVTPGAPGSPPPPG